MTGPGLDGPTLTVLRAAEILHCSRSRIFELLAAGRLTRAPRLGKVTVLYTVEVAALAGEPPPAPRPRRVRKPRGVKLAESLAAAWKRGMAPRPT